MGVALEERAATRRCRGIRSALATEGGLSMRPDVREIEQALGFDKVQPIVLNPSDTSEMEEEAESLREWYEDDLQDYFHHRRGRVQERR